jgi:hypothetical protein
MDDIQVRKTVVEPTDARIRVAPLRLGPHASRRFDRHNLMPEGCKPCGIPA